MVAGLNPYLGSGLTEPQLRQIIEGGVYADKNWQAASLSYRHSMKDGLKDQNTNDAIKARDEWVSQNVSDFKAKGDYTKLGYAIHAMSDEYAPTHSWKPWSGQKWYSKSSFVHFFGEIGGVNHNVEFNKSVELVLATYKSASTPSEGQSEPNSNPSPSSSSGREPSQPIDLMTPRPMPDTSQTPTPLETRPTPPSQEPIIPIPFIPYYPG